MCNRVIQDIIEKAEDDESELQAQATRFQFRTSGTSLLWMITSHDRAEWSGAERCNTWIVCPLMLRRIGDKYC